jgi:hypothetical protein
MLVLLMTMVVLLFLISLGFLMYQQCAVQITAEDAAAKTAQTYKLLNADSTTGKISIDDLGKVALYRYGFISSSTYQEKNRTKTISYVVNRLSKTRFSKALSDPQTTFTIVNDGIGRNHVVVKVSAQYEIPFGSFLSIMGMQPTKVFTATASAECADVIDYVDTVKFTRRCCDKLDNDSVIVSMISSWMKVLNHDYSS